MKIFSLFATFVLIAVACVQIEAQQYSDWSTPVNLGPSFNTEFNEFHAAISADGLTIFYYSNRQDGLGFYDSWVAQRPDSSSDWNPPENLGHNINTVGSQYGPELSPDGHWLYFCSNPSGDNNLNVYVAYRNDVSDNLGWEIPVHLGRGVNGKDGKHVTCDPTIFIDPSSGETTLYFERFIHGSFNIYESTLKPSGKFTTAKPVSELNTKHLEGHPTVRRDGLEMIFTSDRPGSVGGTDLWFSTRATTHDKWSEPVNLGTLNTEFNDRAAYLSDDGLTLIMLSDRDGGFGANDVYVSTRTIQQ